VFSACAGAALYRKAMLNEIGLFDESLGSYCEDVDLSFRAQLAGYRCRFVPTARVYHRISATGGGPLSSYYTGRNFILVLGKNMPGSLLRRHAPNIIATQLRLFGESLWHLREPAARARLRGQFAALRGIGTIRATRREIQARRKASDAYLETMLTTPEERKKWTSK
jgi:GT2 family glycosyltransferase